MRRFYKRLWDYAAFSDDELHDAFEAHESKLIHEGVDCMPGMEVQIIWGGAMEGIVDMGYILTLPTPENNDIFSAGVVHIPNPAEEEGTSQGRWLILPALMALPDVKEIRFGEKNFI